MLTDRMLRAAKLEPGLYEEVEQDVGATSQALTVVIIVAVATGIGAALGRVVAGSPSGLIGGLLSGIIGALIGWLIWSLLTYFIGTSLFGGTATYGELLRTIGFANSPGVLNILSFIPILGGFIALLVAIWTLVAGVVAIRQALDFDTGKAILTAVVGWLIMVVLTLVIGALGLIF